MGRIDVNPDVLERTAVQMSGTASEISRLSRKMENVKERVEAGWRSESSVLYTMELDVLKNNLRKLAGSTEQISQTMKQTARRVRQIEEENRRMFNGGGGGGGGGGRF